MAQGTPRADTRPMRRPWELFALGGAVTTVASWSALVPWDLSTASGGRVVAGVCGALLVASVVGGGVAFADRTAGQAFVVAAYLTTLVFFTGQSLAAHDLLWPVALLVLAPVALGSFVLAFALGRFLATGPSAGTTTRTPPPNAVRVVVWGGLAVLLAVTGAFLWLFVLGHASGA